MKRFFFFLVCALMAFSVSAQTDSLKIEQAREDALRRLGVWGMDVDTLVIRGGDSLPYAESSGNAQIIMGQRWNVRRIDHEEIHTPSPEYIATPQQRLMFRHTPLYIDGDTFSIDPPRPQYKFRTVPSSTEITIDQVKACVSFPADHYMYRVSITLIECYYFSAINSGQSEPEAAKTALVSYGSFLIRFNSNRQ